MLDSVLRFGRLYRRLFDNGRSRKLIAASGLFDPIYYLAQNPDVVEKGIDPIRHYVDKGRFEGRAPCAEFDPAFYLKSNPDVCRSQLDPFLHYIQHGRSENRPPTASHLSASRAGIPSREKLLDSGLFDPEFYKTVYLDVAFSEQEPLHHYLRHGWQQHRRPSADFDPLVYFENNPDVKEANTDPLSHYIDYGRAEGRIGRFGMTSSEISEAVLQINACQLFNADYYLNQCPSVKAAGVEPVLHYLVGGTALHVDPSSEFSISNYLLEHPEVIFSGINPLVYFLNPARFSEAKRMIARRPPRPDDCVTFEREAGAAYFKRFQFPAAPTDVLNGYISEAVSHLIASPPDLSLEAIVPDVTIIIPVFGQLHYALGCLDSIRKQRSRFSVEVIVADDCSPVATHTRLLAELPWLNYRRNESNLGFISSCNAAAATARGRFLVFLNSDTRVARDWLDELIGAFELFPKAGLTGSALLSPDGTLQEAGAIYWRDGSAWNYGRGQDANHPKYCFARRVDYVSGASIAIPADLWRKLDGFDPLYRPAYCEDADLAFRVRQAGYEVWVQPLSQVIHYEGISHGRTPNDGVKRFQEINMAKFAERWRTTLLSHRPNGVDPDREANRTVKDRILVLDARTPTPDRDSGSFITVRMLRALQELGYQPTFIPQHNYDFKDTYTHHLQRSGIECLYKPYINDVSDALDYRQDYQFVLAYRVTVLEQVFDELRSRMPSARILFHTVDLHFLREEREAALSGQRALKIAAAKTKANEVELFAKVDCSIVHTSVEADIVRSLVPVDNIVEFPYIAELHPTTIPFDARHDLMFLGGMDHRPNADAVTHFVSKSWPTLLTRLPECARLFIVGASVSTDVLELAGPRIVVTGYVSDLRPYFEGARVFIAPIRFGAGIKGKVLQSFCYGTPSVITPIAAEGIGLTSGRESMIVEDDAAFIDAVMQLYTDPILWYSLQSSAYEFVTKNFSWSRCLEIITKIFDTADNVWLDRHTQAVASRLRSIVNGSETGSNTHLAKGRQTWVEPGHFYSPIVDPTDLAVRQTLTCFDQLELPADCGLNFDGQKMSSFFSQVAKRYDMLPFVQKKEPARHYYYENPFFGYGDAIMLGLICLEYRPNRLLEIGSGFSSAAMIDLNDQLFNGSLELTFIEPHPDRLLGLLPQSSRYRSNIIADQVQFATLDIFKELQPNDILFIDSSHVSKMASDVNHIIFNILPVLKPGVLIHVHDIFYPFEYPPSWILNENRSWNEAYLLRAFLQFNQTFEILFNNHFAIRKFPELIESKAPLFMRNSGGSLWMQRS